MKRKLMVLGATGSIGTQTLDVCTLHQHEVEVVALSAHTDSQKLFVLARRFRPKACALTGGGADIPEDLRHIAWYFGAQALEAMVRDVPCDDVLVAVVGMASLPLVVEARKQNRRVLLANKETLVAGGQVIMPLCRPEEDGTPTLLPVDSEHSAIFQCLQAKGPNQYESIVLTASGGPFRQTPLDAMRRATKAQALKHPNWVMGQKITIDSATMFNKALEIVEAKWLFDARPEQIEVLIHPQSIVHSMVSFQDGAVLAQLGTPDMRIPIAYAMFYPRRLPLWGEKLCLANRELTFETPDPVRFPSVQIAYDAMRQGGAAACIFNAANEVAVEAFLRDRLAFGTIFTVVEEVLAHLSLPAHTTDEILEADRRARALARQVIHQREEK